MEETFHERNIHPLIELLIELITEEIVENRDAENIDGSHIDMVHSIKYFAVYRRNSKKNVQKTEVQIYFKK